MARPKPVFTSLSASRSRTSRFPWPPTLLLLLLLLLIPPTLVTYTLFPPAIRSLILAYALTVNAATFLTYRHDKNAARGAGWRVRETSLHLWALAGGWPAAYVAQRILRHKTHKRGFQVLFWGTVVGEELLCLGMLRLLLW